MKNILLAISACTLLSSCIVARYDNNEYEALVKTKVLVDKAQEQCPYISERLLDRLEERADVFKVYTKYRAFNEQTHDIAVVIADNIDQLAVRAKEGNISTTYCITKTDLIKLMAEDTLTTLDKKVR